MNPLEPNAMVAYCNCMNDIKQRIAKVNGILAGHSPMKDEGLDGEVVCMLLRKVGCPHLSGHSG